ncbi:MAG: BREX-1 system phosphatase PglZ type A [Planctomycetaceae bacterium]
MNSATLEMETFEDGIRRYTQTWWQIDSLYRQFVFHSRESNSTTLFVGLNQAVEQNYSNRFLLPLGDRWQAIVDQSEKWAPQSAQREFFLNKVQTPFLAKNKKVCVIISDGLRYEIGHEFAERIRRENRYSAAISHMVTGLPSYTQLGMAALLPNEKLQINLDDSATVSVNGRSSAGTNSRSAIVAAVPGKKGTAIQARDLLAMNAGDSRVLFRDHDFVYVYHNVIDATGDKVTTERDVFLASDQTIEELVQLVKKLTAANASNILVTADHGFIFQNGVEESDFVAGVANDVESDYRDRRFLLGKQLEKPDGMHHYTSAQLGLEGDVEVLIPNSINRLRLSGSGFRYVHGGCTLQEIVVPLIEINKSKQDDVQQVPVQIIPASSTTISTGQLAVRLYQEEAASEKLQPRTLTVGLYSESGDALSDLQEVVFDRTSDNPREREHTVKLVLSRDADEYNGQQVYLRLKERIGATTHFADYLSQTFTVRRAFEQDFDF